MAKLLGFSDQSEEPAYVCDCVDVCSGQAEMADDLKAPVSGGQMERSFSILDRKMKKIEKHYKRSNNREGMLCLILRLDYSGYMVEINCK